MAGEDDSHKQPATDEETPLLVEQRADIEEGHQSAVPDENGEEPESEPTPPKTRSWYLWRLLWTILGALILALFIKGWVDAGGDVDVGFSYWKISWPF